MRIKEEWQKPFDLQKGPLLRCFVLNTSDKMILSFNMHHIISDGWSIGLIQKELMEIYMAYKKDKPKREFKDNVNDYFNKTVYWQVKYFNLLNEKK